MSVDRAIQEAIHESVKKIHQPVTVGDKLIKWFEEVMSGNENIDNEGSVYPRLEMLCAAVEIEESQLLLPSIETLRIGNLSNFTAGESEEEA